MSASKKNPTDRRTIRVGALARVEGEGTLHLSLRDGELEEARLDIYEPPRFFESFLRGRDYQEVPDITARICGICPVAYQMGTAHALEKAMGVFDQIDPPIRGLRNLLYCGEWIESHVLHMFLLHLPDFLGYESAISMIEKHGQVVKRALRIKKLGNSILELVGGRAVHPVNPCVGGFHKAPDPQAAAALVAETRACLDDMCELTLLLTSAVKFPAQDRDYEFVALCPADEYPMNLGRIRSNKGLDVEQEAFADAIEEKHMPHSTALHAMVKGRGAYMVGPLARLSLNHEKLHPRAAEVLAKVRKAVGCSLPWRNSFLSLLARGIETVHALALAADLLAAYRPPSRSRIPITPRAGIGGHGTEAPRGICWHQYRTQSDGTIAAARIIPPTSQNQMAIEADLFELAARIDTGDDEKLALACEHLIRNYDPCISCSVHALRITRTELQKKIPASL